MSEVKRMKLGVYRSEAHTGPRIPCMETLKKKIDTTMLPGDIVGGEYFVWVNEHYIPTWPDWHPQNPDNSEAKSKANAIAQRFIDRNVKAANESA